MEPGLFKALEIMTSKLMMTINGKLGPMAKTVFSHTIELRRLRDEWMRWRVEHYTLKLLTNHGLPKF